MVRGETRGRDVPTGSIVVIAGLAVILMGAGLAVVRPWHAERELGRVGSHRLVLRVRGNALGSRCELEDTSVEDAIVPSACGVGFLPPEYGPDEVVRTEGSETCLVELAPLRQIACVPGWAEWMIVRADFVALAQTVSYRSRITVVDRATGQTNRFDFPADGYADRSRADERGPLFRIDTTVPQLFRLERDGFVPISTFDALAQ